MGPFYKFHREIGTAVEQTVLENIEPGNMVPVTKRPFGKRLGLQQHLIIQPQCLSKKIFQPDRLVFRGKKHEIRSRYFG